VAAGSSSNRRSSTSRSVAGTLPAPCPSVPSLASSMRKNGLPPALVCQDSRTVSSISAPVTAPTSARVSSGPSPVSCRRVAWRRAKASATSESAPIGSGQLRRVATTASC
jgi:hypothetical protein